VKSLAFLAAITSFLVLASARAEPTVTEIVVRGEAPPRSAGETRRDGRLLSLTPHHTASDLLLTVPGVFVTQHSGEGKAHQIFFRGFDAVHGQDLELWVAGAPVNEVSNVHGQGYADLHFVMPEVVQQVHAQPGPYDPRQGDFAVAGSVRFDLGYAEPGVTAKLDLGSYGTRRGFVAYRPPGASAANFGAAEIQRTDGFGEGRAASRASALGQAEIELGSGYRMRLMASTFAGRFGSAGVLRLDDIERGQVERFDSYDTDQGGRSERTQVVATLEGGTGDSDFGLSSYLVRRSLVLRSNYTGYLQDPLLGDSTQQINEATTLGLRAWSRRRLDWLSDADGVEVGISARSDFIEQSQRRLSSLDDRVTKIDLDAEVRAVDVGGYLDLELRPLRRLRIRGGVRADGLAYAVFDQGADAGGARSAQGVHVGGKATVELWLVRGLSAVGSYGEGFRSPQARSLQDGERTPFTSVRSQELGLRLRDERGLTVSAAVYRTTLSDDLVFDEATASNRAAPATLRLGGALDLVAEPTDWFHSVLGFTYTHATFSEAGGRYAAGDLLPFVPQVVLRAELGLTPTLTRLGERELMGRFGIAGTFLYRRPIPYGGLGSNVMRVDAQAGARFGEFELLLEAYNLLGQDFYDGEFVYASNFARGAIASEVPARHVTAGAPRTLLLSFAVHI
jgi:iron complex outermembrane recepter protein